MGLRDLVDGFTNAAQSVVQPAASVLSGMVAQPVSGLAGLFTGNPDNVAAVQNALTYQPNTQAGRDGLSALQRAVGQAKTTLVDNNPPVANAIDAYKSAQDWIGDRSPVLGAAIATLPTAAMLFAGPGSSVARDAFATVGKDALANSAGSGMRGPLAYQDGAIQWHGSPHTFDAFDSSKIGTGEGAQAYGHGLYLADSPEVAKSYQSALSPDRHVSDLNSKMDHVSIGGKLLSEYGVDTMPELVNAAKSGAADFNALAAQRHARWSDLTQDPTYPFPKYASDKVGAYANLLADAQNKPVAYTGGGALYKVDLPDEHIARMLDWDKPLSEQHPVVQDGLGILDRDMWHPSGADYDPSELGQSIYQRLANHARDYAITAGKNGQTTLGAMQGAASNDLNTVGIPGIRYLDGGSRSAADGTRNTVLFPGNEHLLKILERNGVPIGGK